MELRYSPSFTDHPERQGSSGTHLSYSSISPPNLEASGYIREFSLSPLRLPGSLPYSEASDSWERYFSDISVILITGPLRFFFFREGVLERPDLEAATGDWFCIGIAQR